MSTLQFTTSNSLHPKGQNILVGQINRAGGEFLRAAGEMPHHFVC